MSGRRGRPRAGGSKPRRSREVDLERYRSFIPDWPGFIDAANRPEPTVFRVRRGRVDADEVVARLADRGFQVHPLDGQPGFFLVDREPGPVSLTVEHWLGLLYVQQASTGVAAPALAPRAGERVLDLCAAPGGKTTHLADLMHDRGCLVASEISESRIRGLLGNVYRLGHSNVLAVAADGRDFPEGPVFDRVLVDAPCSGEGTLRRRAGSPPDQSASFLGYVTGVQSALLEKAVRLTRPGGTILYVTCTFSPDENEAVVHDALARLPVDLEPLELEVPHARGLTAFQGRAYDGRLEGAARVYPHHFDSGGLFLARLRRLGDERPDHGWGDVPWSYPPEPSDDRAGPKPAQTYDAIRARIEAGVTEVGERYGISRALDEVGWIDRGGRAWAHTVGEWPLEAWAPGRWRGISLGLRSIEFDTRGRPRPTNDFLRWAGPRLGHLDLTSAEVGALLRGAPLPIDDERRGPVAIGLEGDVIGRGAVTGEGLKSEVPKARARDLLRILGEPGAQ